MLKLRVRAAGDGAATVRIQIPSSGTLYDLRSAMSEAIGAPADSIRISLNKKDEITGDDTLPMMALGIRAGDLIYYLNRDIASSAHGAASASKLDRSLGSSSKVGNLKDDGTVKAEGSSSKVGNTEGRPTGDPDRNSDEVKRRRELCAKAADERAHPSQQAEAEAEPTSSSLEMMEVDAVVDPEKFRSHIPNLLTRLLSQAGGNVTGPQTFLTLALHGVMLEDGFVLVDSKEPWEYLSMPVVLKYTLPDLLQQGDSVVILRCQSLGRNIVVYGVVTGCTPVYRLELSASKFLIEAVQSLVQTDATAIFRDAFALWKEVKDKLTLPLLMLVCERGRLPLPANFHLLPTELKMKILDLLPATALAAVACVCSELRFLSSSEQLWKRRYIEEFGDKTGEEKANWKLAFAKEWTRRKARQKAGRRSSFQYRRLPFRRPFPVPGIVGGDYDLFPNFPFAPGTGSLLPQGGGGSLLLPGGGINPLTRGPFLGGGGSGGGAATSSITSGLMMVPDNNRPEFERQAFGDDDDPAGLGDGAASFRLPRPARFDESDFP